MNLNFYWVVIFVLVSSNWFVASSESPYIDLRKSWAAPPYMSTSLVFIVLSLMVIDLWVLDLPNISSCLKNPPSSFWSGTSWSFTAFVSDLEIYLSQMIIIITVSKHRAMSPLKILLLVLTDSRSSPVSTVILEKQVNTNIAIRAKRQVCDP